MTNIRIKQIEEFNTTPGITEDGKLLKWDNASLQFVYIDINDGITTIDGGNSTSIYI